jgi:hypothetical protein
MEPESELLLVDISPIERFNYVAELLACEGREAQSFQQSLKPLLPLSEQKVSLDRLNLHALGPIEHDNSPLMRCISALLAVDMLFLDLFRFRRHVYLLGDDSVPRLLNPGGAATAPSTDWRCFIEVLGTIGLIYRFNAASKFGYSARGLMQLRLNGWGTILAKQRRVDQSVTFKDMLNFWRERFALYSEEYRALLRLCDDDNRPLEIERIHFLNERVPIRIVT